MHPDLGRYGWRIILGGIGGAMILLLVGKGVRVSTSPSSKQDAGLPPAEHTMCRQAEAEVRAGAYTAALRDAKQDLEQAPDCARAHLLLGLLYERLSLAKPALEHLAIAAKAFPHDERVQTAYGRVLALSGDYGGAVSLLREVTQRDNSRAEAFRWLGYAYMHLPQNPENTRLAEENLRFAIQREPGYVEANYDLGLLLFRQRKAEEALPFVQTAVNRRKHYPRGLYLLARIQRSLGHTEEAERLQKDFEREDRLVKRQENFAARLKTDAKDIEAILGMAQTLQELDKPQEATEYLQRAANIAPEDTRVRAVLQGAGL